MYIYTYRKALITWGFNHMVTWFYTVYYQDSPAQKLQSHGTRNASITWLRHCLNHMVWASLPHWLLETYLHLPFSPSRSHPLALWNVFPQVWLVNMPECWRESFNHMERAELQSHGYAKALITWLRGCFNHMSPQRHPCDRSFPANKGHG